MRKLPMARLRGVVPLVVVVVAGGALLGLLSGTASASGPVAVTNEVTGQPCNPCGILLEGESQIYRESPLMLISQCEDGLEAEVYSNGTGHVTTLLSSHHPLGLTCGVRKCNGVGGESEPPSETEWPFLVEAVGQDLALLLRLCFDSTGNPNGLGAHCDIGGSFYPGTGESHHHLIDVPDVHCSGINRIFDATWEVSNSSGSHDAVEVAIGG